MTYVNKILLLFLLSISTSFAQETLSKKNAIDIALENNYGIKIAENNVKIAENNSSILNNGYLPRITANGGANVSLNNTELTFRDGEINEINGAEAQSYSASIGLAYTLFDGFGRSYNFKRLKETYNLSKLEAQTIIENSILQIFTVYYQVAQLTEDRKNIEASLNISKQRLERAKYSFDYGQSTKLELLNAEVDVNNDSIRYINSQRSLLNAKRDLNLLLGRSVSENFIVDTNISFNLAFNYENLLEKAKKHNVEILKAQTSIELNNYNLKFNKSLLLPSIIFSGSYGYNKSKNDASIFINQLSNGLNTGVNLTWNLFDGGTSKIRIRNSKITADNLEVQKEQIENELERTIANSLETYNNALFILQAEEKNVETNKRNFSRTEEQYKLGQITTIEFRQAQVNLLNAQSNLNIAKYDAKNAELILLQLTGDLLNVEF
ncbi:MAG: TolC family protein [Lutibacter sp.]|uniref:TolC family protein n=1 Tax=Lutibacter sp. TaxID=1925666 RepID=UPI0017B7A7B8|nr:TolC family protein [Lutibacter sp.]MBT8316018.1 TolC family protein [Lutibacter sp.]NNJ56878.1 TolC family protein [Lutibacter sp.]